MEVVTTWTPAFWVDAATNVVTAVLSAWVAVMLFRRSPEIGFGVNDYAARLGNTEREKWRMKESLLAAQKLEDWSRMSTVLAHEISNPLETIQNVLFLIGTAEGVSDEVVNLTRMAGDEVTRVIELSRSTLSFFRPGAVPEPVNLTTVVESVRFLLAPLIKKYGVVLNVESKGDSTIEAFPGEVRQVLLNLVRNACEATAGTRGRVHIRVTGMPGGVEIVVADEGSGIDPAVMPTLFDFGFSTKGANGNGMGLWTVKHIVTKHGGRISVESKLGEATTFTLWWPREYASADQVAAGGDLQHFAQAD
jgi:signal transduction histidine kinase